MLTRDIIPVPPRPKQQKAKQEKLVHLCQDNLSNVDTATLAKMIEEATRATEALLDALRIDWRVDPNCNETPARLARMYVNELFVGRITPVPKITTFPEQVVQPLFVGPIRIRSSCAHHFMPIVGNCWIGCLPNPNTVVGLSKYSRIVKWAMRRPTMQESLTKLIGTTCIDSFNPEWIGVLIQADHLCMSHRGVEEDGSHMRTTFSGGQLTMKSIIDDEKARERSKRVSDFEGRLAQFQASCSPTGT